MNFRWPYLVGLSRRYPSNEQNLVTGPGYFTAISQALAIFRFFSFAMGVGLLLVIDTPNQVAVTEFIVVLTAGSFNVFRIAVRFNPESLGLWLGWGSLLSDVAMSVALVVLTRGLDSPFLIYSLAPVLSASLLIDASRALLVALASGLSVSGAYIVGELGLGRYPWILEGNYLAFSLLYLAVCLLIANLPFFANLNWHRRLRAESRASERARLRREVHDSVAQTLAFLSLKMKWAESKAVNGSTSGGLAAKDVVEVRSMVERAYLSVRDFLDSSQDMESDAPLSETVRKIVDLWSLDTGLDARVKVFGVEPDMEPTTKFHIVQIAREALANVAKHASPGRAEVTVRFDDGRLTLIVNDDGRGFSPSQPRGHGLGIMSERASIVGAEVSVESTPGEGTEVTISYPAPAGSG